MMMMMMMMISTNWDQNSFNIQLDTNRESRKEEASWEIMEYCGSDTFIHVYYTLLYSYLSDNKANCQS